MEAAGVCRREAVARMSHIREAVAVGLRHHRRRVASYNTNPHLNYRRHHVEAAATIVAARRRMMVVRVGKMWAAVGQCIRLAVSHSESTRIGCSAIILSLMDHHFKEFAAESIPE
jgi:hypothetical protein